LLRLVVRVDRAAEQASVQDEGIARRMRWRVVVESVALVMDWGSKLNIASTLVKGRVEMATAEPVTGIMENTE